MRRAGSLSILVLTPMLLSHGAAQQPDSLRSSYRNVADRLVAAALGDNAGYEDLAYLTTRIGHRLSGSPGLERAVEWVAAEMKADTLDNVRTQPVKVPVWVRGSEAVEVIEPVHRPIAMLGLGGSVGTPAGGITAPAVVVGSFDELDRLGEAGVRGKIVVYDVPWSGYFGTVTYRSAGASRAARLGAVASLVRSMTGRSLYTPHTGSVAYDAAAPRIPAAAITVEDAAWMRQMTAMGEQLEIRLRMEAHVRPDADSANVLGEIVGRETPAEVVVLGGHLDSWDVGQGAHDDGAGVVAAWRAVALIRELGLKPRRTIRVVAWTNEENGTRGASAYRAALGPGLDQHVAAIEMDEGAERPIGFGYNIGAVDPKDPRARRAVGVLTDLSGLLESIGAASFTAIPVGRSGVDIQTLVRAGVPGLTLHTVSEGYFDWHHSQADTLDKVDVRDFRRCVASLAVVAYVLADMPDRL
jgi:Iap family predicted aminopeptidase